ncbi:MAG TPA: LptE family protein [Dongiaceae bacterium]|jgi:hypothetical protein|nr:LptE family protein [Dongiaceae bacterium]
MRRRSLFCAGLLALLLSGCAGYQVGPTNGLTAGEKSIQVAPFENRTVEPYLTDAVTASLRRKIQQDGTYALNTHNSGDIILTGTLVHYQRLPLSFQPGDTFTARDYQISLSAQVTARDRDTGKVIFSQTFTGYTTMRIGNDLASTERETLPLLADNLAQRIVDLLANGSW